MYSFYSTAASHKMRSARSLPVFRDPVVNGEKDRPTQPTPYDLLLAAVFYGKRN